MGVMEKFSLQGKVAFVTGAGRHLGKSIALALAEAGADVAVSSRTPSEIEETGKEIRKRGQGSLAIPMDITDWANVAKGVQKIVSELGRIDILVNNAATRSKKSLLDISVEEWRQVIDTNLTGAFICCKAVGPYMIRQGGGRVINISSRVGLRGMANRVPYCSSKAGLILLTKALALEWAPYHILVNAVAPGLMNTSDAYQTIQEKASEIPLKRAGETEEIAPLVVYLASDAGSYMTGEVILVDGGLAVG